MRAIRSEFRKLISTRTAPMVVLLMTAIGAAGAYVMTQPIAPGLWEPPARNPFLGTMVLLLVVVAYVGGARVATDEFRFSTAATTALATPKRWSITAAKAIAGSAVGLTGGILASAAAAAIIVPWSGTTIPALTPLDLAPLFGRLVLVTGLFAAIGVGVGAAIRHQVGAIVGGVVFLLAGDQILAGLLRDGGRFLPVEAAAGFVGAAAEGLASRSLGALLSAAYAVAAVLVGGLSLRRADLGS